MAKKSKLPGKSTRLHRLLKAGYFPQELPPPFITNDIARLRNAILGAWPKDPMSYSKTNYERYSIPRFNGTRRKLAIMNPISYMALASEIAENWIEIRTYLKKSKMSEFKPIFDLKGQRAFFDLDFSHIEERLLDLLARYPNCLRSDISRYYPSIYTHAIAWAMHTRAFCKANLGKPALKKSLGNRLDELVRKGQDQQSIGIPIGPDTSRVLGEIIGVAIEQELKLLLDNLFDRSFRYVDDIAIGFDESQSTDIVQAAIMKAFAQYELEINIDKTQVLGANEKLSSEWISTLRRHEIKPLTRNKKERIEDFFKTSLLFAQENPRANVLVYALKKSRSFSIGDSDWPYYESFVLRIARKNSNSLRWACQILIEANFRKRPVNIERAKRLVVDLIRTQSPLHHEYEVSWALFLSKALKIKLTAKDIEPATKMASSVCALIVLDLKSRGLISGTPDLNNWMTSANKDGLYSEMWLFAYEAVLKKWIPTTTPCYVKTDAFFSKLLSQKVKFYDENKNVPTARNELKLLREQASRSHLIFANVDEYF